MSILSPQIGHLGGLENCDDFSFFFCFLAKGDDTEESVEEEELLLLAVDEAVWL